MSQEAVLQAEARSFLELDIETISELMDDDYRLIQQDGSIEGKEQVIHSLRSQARQWQSAASDRHEIRIYENVAVVVGRWQSKA